MVQPVALDAYRDQLHALLPSGRAWPEETGTTLDLLVQAIAARLAEVDLSGSHLLDEIRPSTTLDLLPDWERVAGLPDICSRLGTTIAGRRASLLEKLVTKPTLNASEFVRIGDDVRRDDHGRRARSDARRCDCRARYVGGQVAVRLVDHDSDDRRHHALEHALDREDGVSVGRAEHRTWSAGCRTPRPRTRIWWSSTCRSRRSCRACGSRCPCIVSSRPTASGGRTSPTGWAMCRVSWRRRAQRRCRGSRSTGTARMRATIASFGLSAAPS